MKNNKQARLVIRFNLKKVMPEGLRLGSKVAEALDRKIEETVKKAGERAKENKRTTILPQDL